MKKVYAAAAQKKVADSLLTIAEKQVNELLTEVGLLEEKDTELKKMYNEQISNLNKQITLYKDQITGYEKLLKREKRKRLLTTGGGVLTTLAALFLFIQK